MDMYKLKFTKLQNEILRLLCIKAGTLLNQRGIARILKVSPTAIAKALPLLKKEKLIKTERIKDLNFISVKLDRTYSKTISFKRTENLKLIYESGLIQFLTNEFPGCDVILFGSYSRGEDTIDSDIDLAIIGSKGKDMDLTKFDELFERTIRIQYFLDLKKIKNKNLKSNILRGIIL